MLEEIDKKKLPKHIAIIMDGNGRWAKKRGLPRVMGHKAGMDAIKKTVRACSDLGVSILTIYAFSTENWKRPQDEVGFLMNLLVEYMRKEIKELNENRVRVKILGEIDMLPEQTRQEIIEAVSLTENNDGLQFNIALNYGGRAVIVNACRKAVDAITSGAVEKTALDERIFRNYLYTGNDADPDIIIRTSGEQRLSNFLLWQGAYSELMFVDRLWPDFDENDLYAAIIEYQGRDRRFGALK
jgi:undecaprenyl diphosphate synthase